jgi:hypothetical protein
MSDIDEPLRRYRPVAPPDDLRARIVGAAAPQSFRLWDWLPAIAAAALIVLFSALSHGVYSDIATTLSVPDDLRPVEQWLPDDVGGVR